MPANVRQTFAKVVIDETNEFTSRVRRVTVEDNDRLIDKATVTLDDPDGQATAAAREGQKIEIDLGYVDEFARIFVGNLQRPEIRAGSGSSDTATFVAYDFSAWMMQQPPKTEDHVGTFKEILTKIAERNVLGGGKIEPDMDTQYTTERPLRQVNMRDWEFIVHLMNTIGGRGFVEWNREPPAPNEQAHFYWVGERKLDAMKPQGTLRYCPGIGSILEFRYRRDASKGAPAETATVEDPTNGQPITSPTPPPVVAVETVPPPIPPGTRTQDDMRPKTTVAGAPSTTDASEVTRPQDPTRRYGQYGEGICVGDIHIRAKGKMTMLGLAPWAEGDWYVRKVVHVFERNTKPADEQSAPPTPARKPDNAVYQVRFTVTR